jgi:tetratricopeptide (TPR) repeat protein
LAYQYSGDPARAALLLRRSVDICEAEQNGNQAAVGLSNLSEVLRLSGQLGPDETAALRVLVISRKNKFRYSEGMAEYLRGLTIAATGIADEAETALRRSLVIWFAGQNQQAEGAVNTDLAQHQLWQHQPAARLQGEAALGLNDLATAEEHLHHALNRALAVNLVEQELPALTALAELHRRRADYATARDLLEQIWDAAEHGPYPLLHADACNVLAQIEGDQGNTPAAIAAATRAYQLAWCDGPPYAYHFGLTNARHHLQALGAPEPELPPFDESKFEPMPDVELNPRDAFYVDMDHLGDGL